jgi:hypothetical protein
MRRHIPDGLDRTAIDDIWIACAARLGFRVIRTADAYATADGRGDIGIGTRETLDREDSLAQLVMHELCHALVQGEDALSRPDWGLDNTSDRDDARELACLRLQAHLAADHGLRLLMAPTTPWRSGYMELPVDALSGDDASVALARAALARPLATPFRAAMKEALASTARALAEEPEDSRENREIPAQSRNEHLFR